MSNIPKKLRADLSLLGITAIWGSSFILMKNILDSIPSFAYLAFRFLIASVILIIIFHKRLGQITRKTLIYGSIIGLMLFGGMALQVTGLHYTTASNSAFITGLNVIMVPVVSAFMLKKKPGRNAVFGVLMAFAGLFFLSGGLSFSFNKGDILTLLCAVCFALQIIFIDRFTNDQDAILLSIVEVGFTAVLSLAVWLGVDYQPVRFSSAVVVTLLITGVLGTALAYAVQTVFQRDTSPTHTALIFTAEPVFGVLFAMIIPNVQGVTETLKVTTVIGCILILGGTLISEFMPQYTRKYAKDGDVQSSGLV